MCVCDTLYRARAVALYSRRKRVPDGEVVVGALLFALREWTIVIAAVAAGYLLLWRGAYRILHTSAGAARAVAREASAFESAELGSSAPVGAWVLDAWSYRVAARFAGRIRVVVTDDTLIIAGPRVPRPVYAFWVWAQALCLVGAFAALTASVVLLSLAALGWFGVLLIAGVAIALTGAGLWPGLGEMGWVVTARYDAVDVPRSSISDVRLGKGWSRGGFDEVLFLYRAGVDKVAEGRAVSFFAPDEDGHLVRYGIHIHADDDVARLAAVLSGSGR